MYQSFLLATNGYRVPRKNLVLPRLMSILFLLRSRRSKRERPNTSALNMLAMMPMESVTAKPRMGPVPKR